MARRDLRRHRHVHRQPQQVGPVEVVHQLHARASAAWRGVAPDENGRRRRRSAAGCARGLRRPRRCNARCRESPALRPRAARRRSRRRRRPVRPMRSGGSRRSREQEACPEALEAHATLRRMRERRSAAREEADRRWYWLIAVTLLGAGIVLIPILYTGARARNVPPPERDGLSRGSNRAGADGRLRGDGGAHAVARCAQDAAAARVAPPRRDRSLVRGDDADVVQSRAERGKSGDGGGGAGGVHRYAADRTVAADAGALRRLHRRVRERGRGDAAGVAHLESVRLSAGGHGTQPERRAPRQCERRRHVPGRSGGRCADRGGGGARLAARDCTGRRRRCCSQAWR